jgi:hypothetical protein
MAQATRAAPWRNLELSDEVVRWYVRLGVRDRAFADRALDRLVSSAESLRMPHSRALAETVQ